jgi:hypothetical protein
MKTVRFFLAVALLALSSQAQTTKHPLDRLAV